MLNMALLFFGFVFLLSASPAKAQLSPFQKNIQICLEKKVDAPSLENLEDLYSALDKSFLLRTTEIIYREVTFKKKSELQKLKFEKGKIALFRVLDDKTVKLINNDARQKGLTEDSAINQLLIGADVQQDWLKAKEIRSDQHVLQYSRRDGRISALSFQKIGAKAILECSHIDLSDICLCRL